MAKQIEKTKKYQLGLVLSGGGARGVSHLGSAKALMEHGYKFDVIAGTSIGAIVGSVLANGFSPDQVMSMLTPKVLKSFVRPAVTLNSLMTMDGAANFLKKILPEKNIENFKIPFVVTTTNFHDGKIQYFNQGPAIPAIMASASIPIVFPPVTIEGVQYVDGGVLNNLPVRHIRKDCEKVIGFHVNPETLGLHHGEVSGLIQIAERSFHLAMLGNVIPDKVLCDFFLEHKELEDYTVLDFSKAHEIYEIGYKNTKKVIEEGKLNFNP